MDSKQFKLLMQPRNYIPNFLKIRTKEATLVPLEPKPAQLKLLEMVEQCKAYHKPVRIIILKARQLGFSTYAEGLIFNDEVTNNLKNGLIIAHEDGASQNLYTMYKTFYDNLPPELTPMTKYSNAQEMLFENPTTDPEEKRNNPGLQSTIKIRSARNVNTGRSNTFHNMHCSEVAFWQDAKTLMTAILQCVPDEPYTMVFIESTANGVGGWFYDFWKAAEKGENDYIPLFFAWYEEPTYVRAFDSEEDKEEFVKNVNYVYKDKDGNEVHTEEWEVLEDAKSRGFNLTYEQLNWRKWAIKNKCNGDVDVFHQEYPSTPDEAFIASGRPRFATGVLKQYRKKVKTGLRGYLEWTSKTPGNLGVKFVEDPKGYIEIWKQPENDKFYCLGGDVAEGLITGDYSTALIGDEDFDVCAAWHGHIDPDLFGEECVKLGVFYNDAYLGIEANNHGLTAIKAVQRLEYWNIYFSKTFDKITETITQKVGWATNQKTKPLMINKLAEFIREKYLGMPWLTLVNECLTYIIEDNGSTNAQEGCHDDTVMATAILLQLLLEGKGENYVPEVTDKVTRKPKEDFDRPHRIHEDDEENRLEVAE
jgi:hypothetical protein